MSKKNEKIQIAEGTRITDIDVNSEKYMPLYEFLMYDSTYFTLSPTSKLLYSFLRNKLKYFKMQTEANEQGMEGTRSYRDDSGYIYLLADNTELTYLFQISEPTLVKIKKELARYGLLEEVRVKDAANRIYIKKPLSVDEKWTHIETIKSLREEKKAQDKLKRAKYDKKKTEETLQPTGNLKNLSHGNLKNLSHGNLKNLSKIQSNKSKSNLISKIQSNLSKSELPEMIQTVILQRVDKIDENKLNIIINLYDAYKMSVTENQFRVVLVNVLSAKVKSSFKGLLEKSLKTEIAAALESQTNTTRKENGLSEAVKQQLAEEQEQSKQEAQSSYTDMSLDHLNELLNTFNELAERGNTSAIEQLAKIETEIASRLQRTGVM